MQTESTAPTTEGTTRAPGEGSFVVVITHDRKHNTRRRIHCGGDYPRIPLVHTFNGGAVRKETHLNDIGGNAHHSFGVCECDADLSHACMHAKRRRRGQHACSAAMMSIKGKKSHCGNKGNDLRGR